MVISVFFKQVEIVSMFYSEVGSIIKVESIYIYIYFFSFSVNS